VIGSHFFWVQQYSHQSFREQATRVYGYGVIPDNNSQPFPKQYEDRLNPESLQMEGVTGTFFYG